VRARGPFDHPDFLFELKHDGWRALTYIEGDRGELVSRKVERVQIVRISSLFEVRSVERSTATGLRSLGLRQLLQTRKAERQVLGDWLRKEKGRAGVAPNPFGGNRAGDFDANTRRARFIRRACSARRLKKTSCLESTVLDFLDQYLGWTWRAGRLSTSERLICGTCAIIRGSDPVWKQL
jgi:hypothetical protein